MDKMREAFEAWAKRTHRRPGTHFDQSFTGQYKDNRIAAKWAAWQAALEHVGGIQQQEASAILKEQAETMLIQRRKIQALEAELRRAQPSDKLDAERYRAWHDALVIDRWEFATKVAEALPNDDRNPTAEEWDAAIDAAIRASNEAASQDGGGDAS